MSVTRPEGTRARQAHLLDCAIEVVGTSGLRGLTHRALDRAAGLPEGSCSVYYRTRQALLGALADHVAAQLTADVRAVTEGLPADDDDPSASIAATIGLLIDWSRTPALIVTMSELSLEAVRTPALQESMRSWRRDLVDVICPVVERHRKEQALLRAQTLVAAVEGVAIQSLSVPDNERENYLSSTLSLLISAMAEHGSD